MGGRFVLCRLLHLCDYVYIYPGFEKLGFVSMTMLGFLLGLSMAWEPSIEIEKRGIAIQLLGENRHQGQLVIFLPVRWNRKLQTVVSICLFGTGVDPWCFLAISMTILIVEI